MQNKLIEIAVARTGAETEFTIAVFSGPGIQEEKELRRKQRRNRPRLAARRKAAAPRAASAARSRTRADTARGGCVRSHLCAIHPPISVPAIPSTTVMAPTIKLACATDRPAIAMQKRRHPRRNSAHGKRQHRQPQRGRQKSRIAKESQAQCARFAVCTYSGRRRRAPARCPNAAYKRRDQTAPEARRRRTAHAIPTARPICPPAR